MPANNNRLDIGEKHSISEKKNIFMADFSKKYHAKTQRSHIVRCTDRLEVLDWHRAGPAGSFTVDSSIFAVKYNT
jgi:hypothetical protein